MSEKKTSPAPAPAPAPVGNKTTTKKNGNGNENLTDSQDDGIVKKAISFLSGENQVAQENHDKKENSTDNAEKAQRPKELIGFISYLRKNWSSNDENKGLLKKYRSVYSSYQSAKEKEVETLQTYESIAASARLSKEFLALLFGSCIIATFGLFQGSTAVIIGAMLIAPLMMPILGLALGTVWGDRSLVWRSFFTLLIGSLTVLLISASLTFMIPGIEINSEIASRTNPNLFDIFVALASGLVGAYAFVNPKISSSISGVAIAVALMPPLCTIGITLGMLQFRSAFGASLLYLTNLIGISLSASIVFWRLKVHPVNVNEDEVKTRAKRNVYLSSFLLLLIAFPLGYFMWETYQVKKKQVQVKNTISKTMPGVEQLELDVRRYADHYEVKIVIVIPPDANSAQVKKLRQKIINLFNSKASVKLITLPAYFEKVDKNKARPSASTQD